MNNQFIFTNTPIQTPESITSLPERYFSIIMAAFLNSVYTELTTIKSELVLSFNGVGLGIQKRMFLEGESDLYAYNSSQIAQVVEWLSSSFEINQFRILRDDSLEFHHFLDSIVESLVDEGIFSKSYNDCYACSDCGNLITLADETEHRAETKPCNSCGSKKVEISSIEVLVINFDSESSLSFLKNTLINKINRENIGVIKQRFQQMPRKILASKTNRLRGYSLNKLGLVDQVLDPEIGLALFQLFVEQESKSTVCIQGINTAHKVLPYLYLFKESISGKINTVLHSLLPQNTITKILDSQEPEANNFVSKWLPLTTYDSSQTLSEAQVLDAWKIFLDRRKCAKNYIFSLPHFSEIVYLKGDQADVFVLSNQIPISPNQLSQIDKVNTTLQTKLQKDRTRLTENERSIIQKVAEVLYGVVDDSSLYFEKIVFSIRKSFKEDKELLANIVSLIHFGSTENKNSTSRSDLDLHLVVQSFDKYTYMKIKNIISSISSTGVKIDFSMHAMYEFVNSNNEWVYRHGTQGTNFISAFALGTVILGANIYKQHEIALNSTDTAIVHAKKIFSDDLISFKIYIQDLRKNYVNGCNWNPKEKDAYSFIKFLSRALGTWMCAYGIMDSEFYNTNCSNFAFVIQYFFERYSGVYPDLNKLCNDTNELSDDEKMAYALGVLDDLNRITNRAENYNISEDLQFHILDT
jgi:hypothetical protein